MENVKVLIRCMTYNHEDYIAQALEGFVMQKTTFKFVAIVHDDASTDGTAAIIREYAEEYPAIIKPIYETENLYSKGNGALRKTMDDVCRQYEHDYIALCEGDDYWTDPYKLQKQVDFLESHPDFVVCSCGYDLYIQNTKELQPCNDYSNLYWKKSGGIEYFEYTKDIYNRGWFTQPLTTLYRNGDYLSEMPAEKYAYFRDTVFYYYVLKQGKGALLKDVMGVYRRHDGGIFTGRSLLYNQKVALVTAIELYNNNDDDTNLYYLMNITMYGLICSLKVNPSCIAEVLKIFVYYIRKAPKGAKLQLFKQFGRKILFLEPEF